MKLPFQLNDGGRSAAGYRGVAGDCVCRAVAIASGRPYQEVYDTLAKGQASQRRSKRVGKQAKSARNGVHTSRKWFDDYMTSLGFKWTPTMTIGSGCKVHLAAGELPMGRLVVRVSKHLTAVIDGVLNDTYDCQREVHHCEFNGASSSADPRAVHTIQRRCVYGYWTLVPSEGNPSITPIGVDVAVQTLFTPSHETPPQPRPSIAASI